jgi:hypothetical protein
MLGIAPDAIYPRDTVEPVAIVGPQKVKPGAAA